MSDLEEIKMGHRENYFVEVLLLLVVGPIKALISMKIINDIYADIHMFVCIG